MFTYYSRPRSRNLYTYLAFDSYKIQEKARNRLAGSLARTSIFTFAFALHGQTRYSKLH